MTGLYAIDMIKKLLSLSLRNNSHGLQPLLQ